MPRADGGVGQGGLCLSAACGLSKPLPQPGAITERGIVRALEPFLPQMLSNQQALLAALERQAQPTPSTLPAQLAVLDAQEQAALELLDQVETARLRERLVDIKRERERLLAQQEYEQRQAELDDQRRFLIHRLASRPEHYYHAATDDEKALLLAELIDGVEISTSGWAAGRSYEVVALELGGNTVSLHSSRCLKPSTSLGPLPVCRRSRLASPATARSGC
jgi:hypothetical protein